MPRLISTLERLGHTLYSGWIADTRPGGMGVSHQTSFTDPMRLYVSDIGDKLRTNMYTPGQLSGDRSCSVLQMGFHVSFSNEARYHEFFNTPDGSSFTLNVLGESVHKLNASEFHAKNQKVSLKPTYDHGIRIQQDLPQPVAIPSQATFDVMLKTGPEFADCMKHIDNGFWTSYAEVKHFMNVLMTREVL